MVATMLMARPICGPPIEVQNGALNSDQPAPVARGIGMRSLWLGIFG